MGLLDGLFGQVAGGADLTNLVRQIEPGPGLAELPIAALAGLRGNS